jgi:ubiquinol-cytochrome c reductase iron-sulfur subunit
MAFRKKVVLDTEPTTRRDMIFVSASTSIVLGGSLAIWSFESSMRFGIPFDPFAHPRVDLTKIPPGQGATVLLEGRPVFVRHRTSEEIVAARSANVADLIDPLARNAQLNNSSAPATDLNRVKNGREQWLVVLGVCTHLGCGLLGQKPGEERGNYGGWFCPCHGSQYDTSGRVRVAPATENLPIPPYRFVSDTVLEIG